jgi:type II secretion system (T2SS) protein E
MPPRKRLGQLLTELKVIDEHQLQSALGHQKQWGGKLGVILVQKGFCREEQLVSALSQHLSMPAVKLSHVRIDPRAVRTVSKSVAEKLHVFAYEVSGSGRSEVITIAMSDPTDLSAVDQLAFHTGKRIKPMLAGDSDVIAAIQQYYAAEKPREEPPPAVPPGSRPLVEPLARGPGASARPTPAGPMAAVRPGTATPSMVKRIDAAARFHPTPVPHAAAESRPAAGNGAAPVEPMGIDGEDLPADAPMEGLEPIAAHAQGEQSVEGAEEVAGQGTPADAVIGLEEANPREAVEPVEVETMEELEASVRPQDAPGAAPDPASGEAPPLEDQAALQGWAEGQQEGVDLETANPVPSPPPAEGGWSYAPAGEAAPGETFTDELPIDAIMGTADVLDSAPEPAAGEGGEAPAAWSEVADPLAAQGADPSAVPEEGQVTAPISWAEEAALVEAAAQAALGGEPREEFLASGEEGAEASAEEQQPVDAGLDPQAAPDGQEWAEEIAPGEERITQPQGWTSPEGDDQSHADEQTQAAQEEYAEEQQFAGEQQYADQDLAAAGEYSAEQQEYVEQGQATGWFGAPLSGPTPLAPADLGTLAALGLEPSDGAAAQRVLACLVRVLNRRQAIDLDELSEEIRESLIGGAAAAQVEAEAQPPAEELPSEESAGGAEASETERDPYAGSHES